MSVLHLVFVRQVFKIDVVILQPPAFWINKKCSTATVSGLGLLKFR